MELRRVGVEIGCERCRLIRGDGPGDFEIVVPVGIGEERATGIATLHCTVSDDRHEVELMGLLDSRDPANVPREPWI